MTFLLTSQPIIRVALTGSFALGLILFLPPTANSLPKNGRYTLAETAHNIPFMGKEHLPRELKAAQEDTIEHDKQEHNRRSKELIENDG